MTPLARLFILLAYIHTEQHRPVVWTCASVDPRGGVLFQIDQNVPVRSGRRIGESLLNKFDSTRVNLFGQVSHLRRISRILELHQVLRVQTNGATLLVFRKQILHEIDDGCISVVAFLREEVRHACVSFNHEIIQHHDVARASLESCRQSFF